MKRKKLLSWALSAAVAVTMCFGTTGAVFAGTEPSSIELQPQSESSSPIILSTDYDKVSAAKNKPMANVPVVKLNAKTEGLTSTQFKVTVPSTGNLYVQLVGHDTNHKYNWSVTAKTKGFSDWAYFVQSNSFVHLIAVKKGTYTFTVDAVGDEYEVTPIFKAFKESKYGKKKSKAVKIKRNKYQNGLMITGAQKTHWYKFKNTKKKKVKLVFETGLQTTGKGGGLKITFYKGKKSFGSQYIWYNDTKIMKSTFTPRNALGNKLTRGTYYIKVQPYNKATGYFKVKWK